MNKKGFTLIELLVVIAIIGLLSTLAVFSLNSARTKARDAKRISDMKMLSTAMEMFATEGGTYLNAMGTEAAAGELVSDQSAIEYGDETLLDLSTIQDPSGSGECVSGGGLCDYTLGTTPNGTGYEICFYIEKSAGNLTGDGVYKLVAGGSMSKGCTLTE